MTVKLANWPAPNNITALSTTRKSGFSQAPYTSNNLALHVGDNEYHVQQNRQQLIELLHLPNEPVWLEQTHSTKCIVPENTEDRKADASSTRSSTYPLAILTADCLPITLCNRQGTEIAAIHAGWRGLFQGIVENTLIEMQSNPHDLLAWIGPAISQAHYEVGEEVYYSFTEKYPETKKAFQAREKKWMANLPLIAELVLHSLNVRAVYQSGLCTYESNQDFYSYRKASQTGRIATLIWFNKVF